MGRTVAKSAETQLRRSLAKHCQYITKSKAIDKQSKCIQGRLVEDILWMDVICYISIKVVIIVKKGEK